jgi:hypothetical protein
MRDTSRHPPWLGVSRSVRRRQALCHSHVWMAWRRQENHAPDTTNSRPNGVAVDADALRGAILRDEKRHARLAGTAATMYHYPAR